MGEDEERFLSLAQRSGLLDPVMDAITGLRLAMQDMQMAQEQVARAAQTARVRAEAPAPPANAHPPGACGVLGCAVCEPVLKGLIAAAWERGNTAAFEQVEHYLTEAGGEQLRDRVALAVERGAALVRQRTAAVQVVDG